MASALPSVWAAKVLGVTPQGEVAQVRQVAVRFNEAVVPLGDLRRPAPMSVACSGPVPAGEGRWTNDREWVHDFRAALPPGVRCTVTPVPGWAPLQGSLDSAAEYRFSTGGPAVLRAEPYDGATIEEDQHFLLRLTGAATASSVAASAWCEVDGIGERIAVRVVDDADRQAVLAARRVSATDATRALLLTCARPLPAQAKLRLVWGEGIAASVDPSVKTKVAQRFRYQVRPKFTAEFTCEREKAQAPCMPLRPLALRFSVPVPRATLQAARLVGADGKELAPKWDEGSSEASELQWPAPLPENAQLRITLPRDLLDPAGRPLANAASFPLAVATGPAPPIAKFAAAPFGIIEWGPDAMMPVTLRHVQVDLKPGATPPAQGAVRLQRIEPKDWLKWMGELDRLQGKEMVSRAQPLLARNAALPKLDLPQLAGNEPRPFEVVGIPLHEPGYHVIEIESRLLGTRLLDKPAPMYVRTGVLVTNLGVHFKHGRENSLAWVTTLDRAQPVNGADVTVHDCNGQVLWQGRSDANGLARVPQALPDPDRSNKCAWQSGYFVTASQALPGSAQRDTAFVFSSWQKGIEPWRFNVATAMGEGGPGTSRLKLHTVFDRTLLRAGETVSMKHLARAEVGTGLADASRAELPTRMKIVHVGSGDEVSQALAFDSAGRAALSSWNIPANAKLGVYEVQLRHAQREWTSGRFRVEEFRLPLLDARLSAPKGPQVAPAKLDMALQLTHLSGGGVARAPVRTSALLRNRAIEFDGYAEFSFLPPREPGARDASGESGDDEGNGGDGTARLVVDKQTGSTDANGAATLALAHLPKLTQPAELQVETSFNDPNGEVQTVSATVPLWPAARVVGLRSGRWSANAGTVKFQALVLGLDGKPIPQAKVSVSARSRQWTASRKRLVGGFYAYDQQVNRKDLGLACEGQADARGLLLCEVDLKTAGEVELVARSADEAGHVAEAATTVWVSRQGETWFEQDNDDRIDVLAEKTRLAPGDTARLQVRMPYRQATALVTVEREGVLSSRVVQLVGDDPVVELPIPKAAGGKDGAASWAPNVYASVLVLRGRVRHVPWYSFFSWGWRGPVEWWRAFRFEARDYQVPTAMVDLAKPSHKFGMVQLQVGLDEHKLDVKVSTDASSYAVRQTVKTKVQVTRGGQPAAGAEIAFAAVDEALLALGPNPSWATLEAMFQPRPWSVETATAYSEIIGRRHYGRKAVAAGGGGGRNPTRELFDTLLLWRGSVVLDARGEASIDVPLNDSLTSFRLVALATEGSDRFGTGSTTIRVTQDLQMLPGLPPVAREGDQFDAGFTLRNTTAKDMAVQATLAATVNRDDPAGVARQPLALAPLSVTVPAGGAVQVKWPIEVPSGAFSIAYEAAAQQTGGAARDRVRQTQFVRAAVPLRVWQATLQQLDGSLSLPVAPPADALPVSGPKAGGLQIGLQPTLAGALPGIRRFFETYPFSCLEQQTSRALALNDPKAWGALGNALNGYLDTDGLALYYPAREGDAPRGSDRLTAYLIAAAHEAGQALPDAPRERMLQALGAFVEGRLLRQGWSPASARGLDLDVRKLAAIEALSRHGRASAKQLQSIQIAPNLWPTGALIDWLRILKRLDGMPERDQRLQEAVTLLRARLTYAGTTLKFSTEETDFWWWQMDSADANAARLILAVVDDPAWKDELPRLVTGALGRQQRAAWLTTTANLWGVLALNRFAAKFESQPVTGRTLATLGTASATHDWSASPASRSGGRLMLPWPSQAGSVAVTQQGSGRPWLAIQALSAVPLKAPLSAGYRLTRSISAVERKTEGQWTRGDVLRVRVEIEAQADMTWVALNDPVPTGATLLGGGLGRDSAIAAGGDKREGSAWLAYEERAQDAFRASWEFMPRGKHVIEYTLRLNNAGRFGLPPSRVEAMYAPDSFGELPNANLEVQP
ncbi:MAG: alpha-2-macroglobulin [Ideonella sp.]|nr:alpha-2-macroglobulin [Ideonella sp.]